MSLVIPHPEAPATAVGHLNRVGFMLTQNMAAAAGASGLPPASTDKTSGLTATQSIARSAVHRGNDRKSWQCMRCSPRFCTAVVIPTRLPKPPTTQSQVCKRGGER
jgi:hypothetical protein